MRIAQLYRIESLAKEMSPDERCGLRQERSKPILEGIFEMMEKLKAETIPQEPLRKAVDYALNQREALGRYLENGWLKIDNNTSENTIRPLALGRNNADSSIMWS